MSELKRSGRFKCKGPVVEENTIEDAYSVDDESSGDDFVVVTNGKGKRAKQSKLVEKRGSGSSLLDTYTEKGTKAKELDSVAAKGKRKLDMIVHDKEKCKKVKRNKGESSKGSTAKRSKGKGKKPYVFQMRTSPHSFYNVVVTLKPIQKACLARISFADRLDFKVDGIPSKIGFYVVDNFNQDMMEIKLKERSIVITKQSICEMLGLRNERVDIMAVENAKDDEMVKEWVDQFKKGKDITPSAVKFLIRKSKLADMNFIVLFTSLMGGFGNGELQGPFIEEEGDPMPEDAEGFLWKLNKYVKNIRKERNGFERNFEAANEVFHDNTFIADVYQQYRAALHYKHGVSQGENCSNISGDNNDEPHKVSALQEYVDKNSKDYDSLVFEMGQATQKEVFARDFEMVLSLEAPVTDRNTPALGSAPQIEPVKVVSYTKSLVARSPFRSRVTDINAVESKEEKKVETWLLNKIGSDQSAVLFETKTRTKASRQQTKSLVNRESIDNRVVDAWSEFLNSLESFRSENSMSRFFLPSFVVLFGREDKAIENMTNFMMHVEKVNERAGRKNMLKLVDLYLAVNLICSKNNLTKDGYRKSMVVTNTNDVVVATVMQKGFLLQTDKRPNDSGVFLMRHMEAYMGNVISKWACGLEAEGKKQNTMLGGLRKRYAATLVLSECNLHRDIIRAQLDDIEVANVLVKK
ncbi:hypothetical protein Tco_0466560 [Tanacetum coccineum]